MENMKLKNTFYFYRAFLQTLADKGEKCGKFAEELRILISQKVNAFKREDHIQSLVKDKDPDVYSALPDVNHGEEEKDQSSDVQNVNNSSNDQTDLVSNLQVSEIFSLTNNPFFNTYKSL